MKMSSMATRIVIGALIAAYMIAMFLLGGIWLWLSLYVFFLIAIYEIYSAFRKAGIHMPPTAGLLFAVGMPLFIHWFDLRGIIGLYIAVCMLTLSIKVFKADLSIENTAYTFFMLFYPCMMMSMLFLMLMTFPGELGRLAVLTSLICPSFTDMAAYFVGTFLGKHKLCPTISPQKSVEGAIGGLAGGLLASVLIFLIAQPLLGTTIGLEHFLIIGILAAVLGQIGDLAASIIKRSTGIKDFGNIFPGHGGVMDRLDSILFVAPVVYIYFSLVIL